MNSACCLLRCTCYQPADWLGQWSWEGRSSGCPGCCFAWSGESGICFGSSSASKECSPSLQIGLLCSILRVNLFCFSYFQILSALNYSEEAAFVDSRNLMGFPFEEGLLSCCRISSSRCKAFAWRLGTARRLGGAGLPRRSGSGIVSAFGLAFRRCSGPSVAPCICQILSSRSVHRACPLYGSRGRLLEAPEDHFRLAGLERLFLCFLNS